MQIPDRRRAPQPHRHQRLERDVDDGAPTVRLQHQRRVVHRHERHHESGDGDAQAQQPDAHGRGLGDGGRGEGRERHRRREVGHDAEVEHEHVRDQQRHAHLEQRRRGHRAGDDVVRDRRDPHTEHKAHEHGKHESEQQVALRQSDHGGRDGAREPGEREHGDDHADDGAGDADGDSLRYLVQVSTDCGRTYETVAVDHEKTSIAVPVEIGRRVPSRAQLRPARAGS